MKLRKARSRGLGLSKTTGPLDLAFRSFIVETASRMTRPRAGHVDAIDNSAPVACACAFAQLLAEQTFNNSMVVCTWRLQPRQVFSVLLARFAHSTGRPLLREARG